MGTSSKHRLLWAIPAIIIIAVGVIAWDLFFLPSSWSEALFRYHLSSAAQSQKKEINFVELATFEWEEVCSQHPYDGDFKHPKYGRIYQAPMRAAHDGVWVLLFIDKSGNPTYISGSCTRGGAHISEFSCLSRAQAVFHRGGSVTCPSYSVISEQQRNITFPSSGRASPAAEGNR